MGSDSMITRSLQTLDDTFSNFLMKKISKEKFEKQLGVVLSSLPFESGKKHFEISVINEDHKDPFFGLYVYPIQDDVMAIVNTATKDEKCSFRELSQRWRTVSNWYIEIDASCFDRRTIAFSPQELSAMLLHEVGHTIYSDKPIERWYRMYTDAKSRMKLADKASAKFLYALYTIPLIVSCMQKSWVNANNRIRVEYAADKAVIEYGYGEAMVSALDKIVRVAGSINTTEESKDNAVKASIDWCNVNISDMSHRKTKLKDELYYQSLRTSSKYFKAFGVRILNMFGVRLKERYTGQATECTIATLSDPNTYLKYNVSLDMRVYDKLEALIAQTISGAEMSYANEAFGRKKTITLPSQYDIDVIEIEIDKIVTHYDRTYVLDLIYETLERIDTYEEKIPEERRREVVGKINSMRDMLNKQRERCLAKKNLNKEYKLFVQYPKGYEG